MAGRYKSVLEQIGAVGEELLAQSSAQVSSLVRLSSARELEMEP